MPGIYGVHKFHAWLLYSTETASEHLLQQVSADCSMQPLRLLIHDIFRKASQWKGLRNLVIVFRLPTDRANVQSLMLLEAHIVKVSYYATQRFD